MGCIPSTHATHAAATSKLADAPHTAADNAHSAAGKQQSMSSTQQSQDGKQPLEPRPANTAVLRQANVFDQLHEEAHKEPSLRDVKVKIGTHNQRLLDGFEQKEREAREAPRLQNVEKSDLRSSKLFDKLQEYEMNDERVRMEPKLQNSFQQRQREMQRASEGAQTRSHT